ncbi:transmembrane protein 94 isoform X1 [Episyrphus balteatus]|uniref:transmembrane protein 94 isoform X1 n=1 Tax=Episyrphus balteatus TaxID=286459 RepID=UPI002486AE7D|nr:transmembrane protein 94 isoform X1 [Episyrphus balteatus]XP_055841698.1 transmembrane protein 94 isoform X1 [Episyrphus balteatus]
MVVSSEQKTSSTCNQTTTTKTNKSTTDNPSYGFSTKAALARLHDEIFQVVLCYESKYNQESLYRKIRSAFVKRYDSPLGWFAIVTSIITTVGLFVAQDYIAGVLLALILAFDLFLVVRENNLRRTEIFRKTRKVLNEIKLAEEELCAEWEPKNYPHVCCPISPCVSLQWTYRDGVIVNLPWALLVKGDHIVLRPGHTTPGPCCELEGKKTFKANDLYGVAQFQEPPLKPLARTPLPDIICCLENTPFLENLKIILEDSLKRPPTIYNQQRYLLATKYIQQWGFILSAGITFLAGILRMYGLGLGENPSHNWQQFFVESPVGAVIPLLPLFFPIMWISMNLWGVARLQAFLRTPQLLIAKDSEKSYEGDLDTPTYDYESISLLRSNVFRNWLQLWNGESELLPRSANVVQVLGSITALCCVDKKGILSWPNPTAEKVFFLHDTQDDPTDGYQSSNESDSMHNNQENKDGGIVAEVLDLTHDQHCPFRLEFDDHEWKTHIKSLKPLGLAILLNTCSPSTHAHYGQFCGHVTAVAMLDKDLVPVTNRYAIVESSLNSLLHGRCLCELAKQIGFTDHACDRFSLEGQLATYRHLQPDVVRRDIRFARQLQLTSKVKVPFPHSLSVVMRENPGGYLSLFTQGTADIILDYCDDFWDGKDLRTLSQHDRKRAQDFYQRSALTAYCTAFAYRPLRHGIIGALSGAQNDNIAYLELPPESKYRMAHVDKSHCDFEGHTKLSHSISTDSLLFSETKDDHDINDVNGCFEMQCHQVFIGMVTMQYQAQTDIVQLVEQLERACIRFVHFSKENELRSRVFSEKMGLESGWNCHISLLSEDPNQSSPHSPKNSGKFEFTVNSVKTNPEQRLSGGTAELNCLLQPLNLESSKTLSSSAPGAISNHDYNMLNLNSDRGSNESINMDNSVEHQRSQDSAMDEPGRSMSILTDSTEQSAPIHFDMSNRAKLPRGIENIRPHLEQVDNVPLQVSLFTDCSAEATREMLSIMQSYGEIVVCLGSSASNANAEIFLQADCSIAVEPLYPQVCQSIDAFTETNILNNKLRLMKLKNYSSSNLSRQQHSASLELLEGADARPMQSQGHTVSPIYISRLLNSLPCSISVSRDDPLSTVALIELSRRFSSGLWNCIQYWACCAGTLSVINILSACLSLPPILTPLSLIYLMCLPVPMISVSLAHIDADSKTMNRATAKKQTEYDSKVFGFVLWCYGCKFITPVLIIVLGFCTFMAHPVEIVDIDEDKLHIHLEVARIFSLLGIILHFVIISASFVHRDHSIWRKNPFKNRIWTLSILSVIILHVVICVLQLFAHGNLLDEVKAVWSVIVFTCASCLLSFAVTEICKWQEIKVNTRYQRRARLDFGTKLGMNSPF